MRHQCVSCESLVLVHVDSWSYCFKCVCVYFLEFCPNSVYLEGFLLNILIPRQITPSTPVPLATAQRFPQHLFVMLVRSQSGYCMDFVNLNFVFEVMFFFVIDLLDMFPRCIFRYSDIQMYSSRLVVYRVYLHLYFDSLYVWLSFGSINRLLLNN